MYSYDNEHTYSHQKKKNEKEGKGWSREWGGGLLGSYSIVVRFLRAPQGAPLRTCKQFPSVYTRRIRFFYHFFFFCGGVGGGGNL